MLGLLSRACLSVVIVERLQQLGRAPAGNAELGLMTVAFLAMLVVVAVGRKPGYAEESGEGQPPDFWLDRRSPLRS